MPRWYILRALLHKELLRIRYNWGLLVLVAVVLVFSGLASVSAQITGSVFGAPKDPMKLCIVYHIPDSAWARYVKGRLETAPRSPPIEMRPLLPNFAKDVRPIGSALILLMDEASQIDAASRELLTNNQSVENWPNQSWRIFLTYPNVAKEQMAPFREWLLKETQDFLQQAPRVQESYTDDTDTPLADRIDLNPLVVTSLAIFSLYLLCFNLFITSAGEEREKRQMLALWLSPATPLELVLAKVLFFGSAGVAVALAVVAMYSPLVLASPLLWSTLVFAAVAYVSIGTIIVAIVRRQTTINTVAMLYLVVTTVIFVLGEHLAPFFLLSLFQFEMYLNRQLQWLISDGAVRSSLWSQAALGLLSIAWMFVAVRVFSRQRVSIAQRR